MARKNGAGTAQKEETLLGIITKARNHFVRELHPDQKEREAYNARASQLSECYGNDWSTLKARLKEITETGFNARDLCHYLNVACIAEGEGRPLQLDEKTRILNNGHLGRPLYHFSNSRYRPGFTGMPGMLFCTTKNVGLLRSAEEFDVDQGLVVYAAPVTVNLPVFLTNLTAQRVGDVRRDDLIKEALLGRTSKYDMMWYRLEQSGAVEFGESRVILPE